MLAVMAAIVVREVEDRRLRGRVRGVRGYEIAARREKKRGGEW